MNKAQKQQNKIYREMSADEKIRLMNDKETTEFYRDMSDRQRIDITFLFMNFGYKLEKEKNPQVILRPYD